MKKRKEKFKTGKKKSVWKRILLILAAVAAIVFYFVWKQQAPEKTLPADESEFSLAEVPAYTDSPYTEIHGNVPYFSEAELSADTSFETYSDLDSLGRCGTAYARLSQDMMPTEERGSIGMIKPSGWQIAKYDWVDQKYLYNRCHLIAYSLAGENANEKNLITGTRYMNTEGMQPFEIKTADYIRETGNQVLYRVTPVFEGDNLVASGVLMEAESIEDKGSGIRFCVYCYNVEPGVTIDYSNGDNQSDGTMETASPVTRSMPDSSVTYVLNTNTMRFHKPDCPSVKDIWSDNREDYTGSREDLIAQGYTPCGVCNP